MREYNELTKKLLAEGYTPENHPPWVRIGTSQFGTGNPLDNLEGGFVYNRKAKADQIFKTPCGIHVKLNSIMSGMSWYGIDWSWENDMATIHCPFLKYGCELNHPILRDKKMPAGTPQCRVAMTDEPYNEDGSYEYFKQVADWWERELLQDLINERKGHYCLNHMTYNRYEERWELRKYDPSTCKMYGCMGTCQYLGIPLSKKKGNVFYDLRVTQTDPCEKETLFEGTLHTSITKGNKAFRKPVSMTICENYVKLCKDDLKQSVMGEWHYEMFFAKFRGEVFDVSIENIRAERKETRDLRQDLADIKDGIKVTHESDNEKQAKQKKRDAKAKREEQKKRKLRKAILEGCELSYVENRAAEKLFTDDEIDEIMDERKRLSNRPPAPEQLTLFDYIGE